MIGGIYDVTTQDGIFGLEGLKTRASLLEMSGRLIHPIVCLTQVLALVIVCVVTAAADPPLLRVRIDATDAQAVARELLYRGYDVLNGSVTPLSFEVVVNGTELKLLQELGFTPQTLEVGRPFRRVQAERMAGLAVPAGYPDIATVVAQMDTFATAYPGIARLVDLTSELGTPATVEGRHLFAMKISDHASLDEDEPSALLVSAHHSREIVSPLIALHAIEQLTTQYGVDPDITSVVDQNEIWIAPVWNPDGYEYVFNTDNLWRKNRRVFPSGTGVDLNRNYPYGWDSACGGSTSVTSQTYRGPVVASEAETTTMVSWAQQRPFAKVSDFHSFAREVRHGSACLNNPFTTFLAAEATALAAVVSGYGVGLSCCSGGNFGYHLATKASHSFLWETATEFQPSYASGLTEAAEVFSGVLSQLMREIPLSGHVTDANTGSPIVAEIDYSGMVFEDGEPNSSYQPFGRYHAFLPTGSYTVTFSAAGYESQAHVIGITAATGLSLDVALSQIALPAGSMWNRSLMVLVVTLFGAAILQRRIRSEAGRN